MTPNPDPLLGPSLLAQQTSTATRQLGCSGAKKADDTRAGGLMPQFCHDTQPGPTASGGGGNALSSWALCFGPVDQEDGAMLRGSRLGHLQAGSPLSDRRWRGLLVKALGT